MKKIEKCKKNTNLFVRHYPQLKSTAVADNPELQRIRQLTDVQSNVNHEDFDLEMFVLRFVFQAKYHKDFNENKGKFTAIADDPATQRAKEQQKNVSQAEYTSKRKESLSNVVDSGFYSKLTFVFFSYVSFIDSQPPSTADSSSNDNNNTSGKTTPSSSVSAVGQCKFPFFFFLN